MFEGIKARLALARQLLPMLSKQHGGIMTAIVIVALVLIVLGALIPVLWPMLQDTQTDIDALNATGSTSTAFLQSMWPIALLVVGLGIVVALILYALRKFGVLGSGGFKGGI